MYSETPPEKLTTSGLRPLRSGASRSKPAASAPRAVLLMISNKWSAMRSTIVFRRSASGFSPIWRTRPTSAANRRPASSIRATRPSASKETMRAPTSTAVSSAISPASHTAIFVVPPPRSTFITRAESGEGRFERVARAHRNEFPRLGREQLADRPGVAAPDGDAGEDQGARVDRFGIDSGEFVLPVDEAPERHRVDGSVARIRSEKNLGLVNDLALGHDVAVVEPLEHEAREDEVRSGRADVDADADETNLILQLEAAPDVAEEDPAARFLAHAKGGYFAAGAAYQPGSIRFGTPLLCSVSAYSLRMYGSSIQYGMEVPPSGMSIAV